MEINVPECDKAHDYSFCKENVSGKAIAGHKGCRSHEAILENDPKMKLKISIQCSKFMSRRLKSSTSTVKNDKSALPVLHSRIPIHGDSAHQSHKNFRSNLPLLKWSNFGRRTPRNAPRRVPASSSRAGDRLALGDGGAGQQIITLTKRRLELYIPSDTGNTTGSIQNEVGDDIFYISSGSENSTEGSVKEDFSLGKDETDFQNQYPCEICHMSFTSYQSLGGHKAHHCMKDDRLTTTDEFSDSDSDRMDTYVEERHVSHSTSEHRCPSCGRIYSNGQAYGGHKRHCKGAIPQDEVAEEVQEPRNNPRVLDFDLSEFPPECDPEKMD